jgi:hypothetical protein
MHNIWFLFAVLGQWEAWTNRSRGQEGALTPLRGNMAQVVLPPGGFTSSWGKGATFIFTVRSVSGEGGGISSLFLFPLPRIF